MCIYVLDPRRSEARTSNRPRQEADQPTTARQCSSATEPGCSQRRLTQTADLSCWHDALSPSHSSSEGSCRYPTTGTHHTLSPCLSTRTSASSRRTDACGSSACLPLSWNGSVSLQRMSGLWLVPLEPPAGVSATSLLSAV
jgi:hypothetical protein